MDLPILTENNGTLIGSGRISEFGDASDTEDNGLGAWGFHTRENPLAPYCSLPIPYVIRYQLKPGQQVTVEYAERQVVCFLADKGPSASLGRLIDVSPSVMKRLRAQTDSRVTIYIPRDKIIEKAKWC